jgi:hypothetical protein
MIFERRCLQLHAMNVGVAISGCRHMCSGAWFTRQVVLLWRNDCMARSNPTKLKLRKAYQSGLLRSTNPSPVGANWQVFSRNLNEIAL